MSAIEMHAVAKHFGSTPVLDDVDLVVPDASITAVLGASGSGKTTLLRLIAGLERVDTGWITIGGRVVDDGDTSVDAQHRGVGYVPQDGALFPHLTVSGNIGFGIPRSERARVGDLVELVGLEGLAGRYPHQLSGGQQQRVALARALAIRPSVVLLDEPFSSLDASLRAGLHRDVARVLSSTGTTTVLVTHDQDEALAMADHITVLQDGRVVAAAEPAILYREPPDLTAATSIGDANVLSADVHGEAARCALGTVRVASSAGATWSGPGHLLLRPEQLALHTAPRDGAVGAVVTEVQFHGHDTVVDLVVEHPRHQDLVARVAGATELVPGQHVWVEVAGTGRAWPVDPADVSAAETLWAPAVRSGEPVRSRRQPTRPPPGARRGGAPRRRGRRGRLVVIGAVFVAGGLAVAKLAGGNPSSSATVGVVVFHVDLETTGRVHLSDHFTDSTTAKGVSSCAAAGSDGDQPKVAPHTWFVPTAPFTNTAEIEVGTIARGYHGPGVYPQSALTVGNGVIGIGQEDYNVASPYATSSMTVNVDGSGVVRFTHAPGDDDTPGPGFNGGISGTLTWTCSS